MIETNGVLFGDKHSYNDFELILKEKSLPFPERKETWIDVPGANGLIDVSTALTGGIPKYKNRPLKFVFDMLCPVGLRLSRRSAIAAHLHGQTLHVILDEEPGYYYEGVCSITSSEDASVNHGIVEISVNAQPYKLSIFQSTDDWLWDPFSFETDIIYDYLNEMEITEATDIEIPVTGMPIVPTFITDGAITVRFKNVNYNVSAGSFIVPDILLTEPDNTLKITPVGDDPVTVSIQIRGGLL